MVEADSVGVEAIPGRGHRPQTHQQAPPNHDPPAEEDLESLGGRRVVRRRRLHSNVEAEQAGVEMPAPLKVGHRETEMVDLSRRNLSGHPVPPPPSAIAGTSLVQRTAWH